MNPNGGPDCLDAAWIDALDKGNVDEKDMAVLEEHLADCARCRALLLRAYRDGKAKAAHGPPSKVPSTASGHSLQSLAKPQPGPGDVLVERYRLDRALGRGTVVQVFLATRLELGHEVAIKVLRSGDPNAAARFLSAAKQCAHLTGPHVARIFDVGRSPHGAPFVVMEYLVGEDLARLVGRGPVAPPDAARYAIETCAALSEAHAAGIVHRNLKPATLFLVGRTGAPPLLKVIDFELSNLAVETPHSTVVRQFGGGASRAPHYMSPEQIHGQQVDHRSDIWSLGVVLYELLTGRRPFRAETLEGVAASIAHDHPKPPSSIRGDVPAALDAIVSRCLEKDPAARFASVAELGGSLAPVASLANRSMTPPRPQPAALLHRRAAGRWRALLTSRRWSRWLWAMLSIGAAAALPGLRAWRNSARSARATPSSAGNAVPANCAPPSLIDDLESDGRVVRRCDRTVRWGNTNDGTGTQSPAPGAEVLHALIPGGGLGENQYAIHTYGSGFTAWGFTLGFSLNGGVPYDAEQHGYKAVSFYAMLGNVPDGALTAQYAPTVLVRVADRFSSPLSELCSDEDDAGSERCFDDPTMSISLTNRWSLFVVPFSALKTVGWGYGGKRTLDPHTLYRIGFGTSPPAPFDFWIDDLYFE